MSTITKQLTQSGVVTELMSSSATSVNHIDGYCTFELGSESHAEGEFEHFSHESGVDLADLLDFMDYDFEYNNKGWLEMLAQTSIQVIMENLPDDSVIKGVEWTGEVFSPQFYNFSTDGYMANWTVDADALEKWLADNEITLHDGHGVSGFWRTAKDDFWYMAKAIAEYLEREVFPGNSYVSEMYSADLPEYDYVWIYFEDSARAKVLAAGGDPSALPGRRVS